jgi:hypothetical protein
MTALTPRMRDRINRPTPRYTSGYMERYIASAIDGVGGF